MTTLQILLVVFAILIPLVFLLWFFQKRIKIKKELSLVRDYFNKVKSIPLQGRLNRVKEIAFQDRNFQTGFDVWKYKYDKNYKKLENEIKTHINLLESKSHKSNEFNSMITAVRDKIEIFEETANSLLVEVEKFIELEGILRNEATHYKKIYRDAINAFELKRSSAKNSAIYIDELIQEIEKDFDNFENNMGKVNFANSINLIEEIGTKINQFLDKINIATQIQLFSKTIIPNTINDIKNKISQAKEVKGKINSKKLLTQIKEVEKNSEAIQIKSKMSNFDSAKDVIEESLRVLNSIDNKVWNEIHSKKIFLKLLSVWKVEIKKFYAIANALNPLIATLKQRVKLSNEESAMIIAYNESLEMTKQHDKILTSKLHNSLDYSFKNLLFEIKLSIQHIASTINLIRETYNVLINKESEDIRSEREIFALNISYSELSASIMNNKFVKDNAKINEAMNHLANNIRKTQRLQNQSPRNIEEIKLGISICTDVLKQIADNFYVTKERFKIAEGKIMWMSKFRFSSNAKDLDSILNQAEIYFNQNDLVEVENILKLAEQTSIIKKNMEK